MGYPSGCKIVTVSFDVGFQKLDLVALLLYDVFHNVANRYDSNYLSLFDYREVSHMLVHHDCHAFFQTVCRCHSQWVGIHHCGGARQFWITVFEKYFDRAVTSGNNSNLFVIIDDKECPDAVVLHQYQCVFGGIR